MKKKLLYLLNQELDKKKSRKTRDKFFLKKKISNLHLKQ